MSSISGLSSDTGNFESVIADRDIQLRNKYILPLDAPPATDYFITSDGSNQLEWSSATEAKLGDVRGPASAVSGNLASFNGTTGKLIQDSGLNSGNILSNPLNQNLDMDDNPLPDRKSTRLNSSHVRTSRMPSSA